MFDRFANSLSYVQLVSVLKLNCFVCLHLLIDVLLFMYCLKSVSRASVTCYVNGMACGLLCKAVVTPGYKSCTILL